MEKISGSFLFLLFAICDAQQYDQEQLEKYFDKAFAEVVPSSDHYPYCFWVSPDEFESVVYGVTDRTYFRGWVGKMLYCNWKWLPENDFEQLFDDVWGKALQIYPTTNPYMLHALLGSFDMDDGDLILGEEYPNHDERTRKLIESASDPQSDVSKVIGREPTPEEISMFRRLPQEVKELRNACLDALSVEIDWVRERPWPTYDEFKTLAKNLFLLLAECHQNMPDNSEWKSKYPNPQDWWAYVWGRFDGLAPTNWTLWRVPTNEEWEEYRKECLARAKAGYPPLGNFDYDPDNGFMWKYTTMPQHPAYALQQRHGEALARIYKHKEEFVKIITSLLKTKKADPNLQAVDAKPNSPGAVSNKQTHEHGAQAENRKSRTRESGDDNLAQFIIVAIVALLGMGLVWYFVRRK